MPFASASNEAVDRALTFAQTIFGAHSAAFYRVDRQMRPYDYRLRDVPPDFHRRYLEEMDAFDPLHVRRLAARNEPIGHFQAAGSTREEAVYAAFLGDFGLVSSIELVFRQNKAAHSGLCLMWRTTSPPASEMLRIAHSVHGYLEFTLPPPSNTPSYGLTVRETDVAELLCCGRTNGEIAELLGIGVATVKTHLIHLYTKLGVETRSAAVGLLSRLA